MEERQFVWDHFKFNAEQRLKGFNFFVLLSIFATGGVFTAIEKGIHPLLVIVLGLFIVALVAVFSIVDLRSRQLLLLTIPAMKEIEATFSASSRLFSLDEAQRNGIIRYTFAFRLLMLCQLLFGIGVAVFGWLEWRDLGFSIQGL